jgi:hypothetical protein
MAGRLFSSEGKRLGEELDERGWAPIPCLVRTVASFHRESLSSAVESGRGAGESSDVVPPEEVREISRSPRVGWSMERYT